MRRPHCALQSNRAVFQAINGSAVGLLSVPTAVVGRSVGLLLRSMRAHQWVKNVLVFVPLVLGGRALEPDAWIASLLGFAALSLTCSATYLINDLWDLEDDRRHRTKRWRPLANGELNKTYAVAMAAIGLTLGILLTALLGSAAVGVLLSYLAITLSYTFFLKRVALVDVFIIALLFTLRLVFGIIIVDVRLSPWLLVFSMFSFLSLSLAKRYTEVRQLGEHGHATALGRGYVAVDAPLVLAVGAAAALGAVLILILYLIEDAFPRDFYGSPQYLWGLPVVLFLFFGRIWLVSQRGELSDDPVEFALKDRQCLLYAIVALMVLITALA